MNSYHNNVIEAPDCRVHCAAALLVLSLLFAPHAFTQVTWFSDDFTGADPERKWRETPSGWMIGNGAISAEPEIAAVQRVCSYYLYGTKPFILETELRGGNGGIVFSMDDSSASDLSQMVWFDGSVVRSGYMNVGTRIVTTGAYPAERQATEWSILTVKVDPLLRRCTILVNHRAVGIDSLRFVSGYAGLVATRGFTEFRSFRITGTQYQGTLGGLRRGTRASFRRVRYVETVGRNFRIYDPERRTFFLLDEAGKVLEFDRTRNAPALQTSADFNGTTFTIAGGKIFRSEGGITTALTTDKLVAPAALLAARDESSLIVLYVADPGGGVVLGLDRAGHCIADFGASFIEGFTAPRGLAWCGGNEIVVADYDRLVIVPATLNEELGARTVPPIALPPAR